MFYAGIAPWWSKIMQENPENANFYMNCCDIIFWLVKEHTHANTHIFTVTIFSFSLLVRGIKFPLLLFMLL